MLTTELLSPETSLAAPGLQSELAEQDAVLTEIDRQAFDGIVKGLEDLDVDTVAELEHTRDDKIHSMFESEGVGRPRS